MKWMNFRYETVQNGLQKRICFRKISVPLPQWIVMRWDRAEYRKKKKNYQNRHLYASEDSIADYLTQTYIAKLNCVPNFNAPKTLTEKINWMKLYYKDPLLARCCDKFAVKSYIDEVMHSDQHSVTTIASWNDADEINFDRLPNSFVLKVNWSSGYNIFIKDKKRLNKRNRQQIIKQVRRWMHPESNSYYADFNWGYRTVRPVVFAEEYLPSEFTDCEYKVFVFQGRAEFTLLEIRADNGEAKRLCIDRNMQPTSFTIGNQQTVVEYPITSRYEEMLSIAEKLGAPFPFVRVDFMTNGQRILVGEMTFYSGGGFSKIVPKEWDLKLGNLLVLP